MKHLALFAFAFVDSGRHTHQKYRGFGGAEWGLADCFED
jgi:hypothetical protein